METARRLKCKIVFSLLVIIFGIAQTEAEHASDDGKRSSRNEESSQSIYYVSPQTYYVPDAYQVKPSVKYVSPVSNQIPVSISSTPKTLVSTTYKEVAPDTSKYTSTQLTKQPYVIYSNQKSYPYVYNRIKAATPTAALYTTVKSADNSLYDEVPKQYHYGYRVNNPHTGTDFGHSEVNDGHSARGYYHVLLPDGRLQNVKYWAGPSGYHATITYESKY